MKRRVCLTPVNYGIPLSRCGRADYLSAYIRSAGSRGAWREGACAITIAAPPSQADTGVVFGAGGFTSYHDDGDDVQTPGRPLTVEPRV
jgi:hypothetical protein